jgi:hypothetical protein
MDIHSDNHDLTRDGDASRRLGILLFVLREKLERRIALSRKANWALLTLILTCLAIVIFCPYYLWVVQPTSERLVSPAPAIDRSGADREVQMEDPAPRQHTALFWRWSYFAALAAAPLVLSFIVYLWITFAQMFFAGLPDVQLLLRSPEYEDLSGLIPVEMLTDDLSLLSIFLNLFAVDVGLSSSLFFLGATLILVGPVIIQAGLSVAVFYICICEGVGLMAAGLAVLYVLFFMLTLMKTWSFYRTLRRHGG